MELDINKQAMIIPLARDHPVSPTPWDEDLKAAQDETQKAKQDAENEKLKTSQLQMALYEAQTMMQQVRDG